MIQTIPLEKMLFLDIETVSQEPNYDLLSEATKCLWEKKLRYQIKPEETFDELYEQKAGLYSEFGQIACISIGMVSKSGKLRIRSFASSNEKELLEEFGALFNHPGMGGVILCAHNGKEFDFPWISRRFLIQGMQPPLPFQTYGKKPWEISHIDTMELWKFGEFRSSVSLELLAHVFGIPSPKDDIDGSMVSSIYHIEKDIARIVKYCEKDVLTLAQVFCRLRQEELISRE